MSCLYFHTRGDMRIILNVNSTENAEWRRIQDPAWWQGGWKCHSRKEKVWRSSGVRGRSNEVSLQAVAFALSVRPLCGVAIGIWLFLYVSVILHSPLKYDATFLYRALDTWRLMSLACLAWFPCPMVKPMEGTAGGGPSPPGQSWFGQCLHFFFESPALLELLNSCTIFLPQPL